MMLSSTTTSSSPASGTTRRSKSWQGEKGKAKLTMVKNYITKTTSHDPRKFNILVTLRLLIIRRTIAITYSWYSSVILTPPTAPPTFILSLPLSCRLAPWSRSFWQTKGLSPSRDTAMDSAERMAFLMKPPVSSNLKASSFWWDERR